MTAPEPRLPEEKRDVREGAWVVTLGLEEVVRENDLSVRWISFEDSRCPVGVMCVWEGQVTIEVEVVHGDGEAVTVVLTRRAGNEPEVPVVAGYGLRLLAVDPLPMQGKERRPEDLTAQIEVMSAEGAK